MISPTELEAVRRYLLRIAERELGRDLATKVDASDVVQDTMIEAQRDLDRFKGRTRRQYVGWLRRILMNNIGNLARRFRATDKRRIGREVSFESLAASSDSPDPTDPMPSPCDLAIQREQGELIRRILDQLPLQYRQAIVWRYSDELTFVEMGERWSCSPDAARMLWYRASRCLKITMGEHPIGGEQRRHAI